MEKCAINFIARRWWKRAEVWLIAILLAAGGLTLGYQAGVWSAGSEHTKQLAEVRAAYDAAMGKRDLGLTKLAEKTQDAAAKVQEASHSAVQAADTASKAADKVNEAVERKSP
jgi:predicted negative regulator of RcsB-dependent stress response